MIPSVEASATGVPEASEADRYAWEHDGGAQDPPSAAPARAQDVELLGEVPGSGYRRPPALVRRADGQVIQLSRLLYLVLRAVDGRRDVTAIAAAVSAEYGRRLTPEHVRVLTEDRLRPLGVLRAADGSEPVTRPSNPLLGLRFRYVVSSPTVTRRITRPFARLFHPAIVGPVLALFAVGAWWVLFDKGLASATRSAFDDPGLLLLVLGITAVSAGFHEFGHAAACRYGGATPGAMGFGLYLFWPAFYTEVNDSYRLGRAGRLRVDLGGLYFNAVVAVVIIAGWGLTRWDALLLVVATQILQMVRQLTPIVRFDGYHVLADLVGVPDLYAHIRPTLLGLLPWRPERAQQAVLKRWARAVVTLWVLVVVPVLLGALILMVVALPRIVGTAWLSIEQQVDRLGHGVADGDVLAVGAGLLSLLAVCLTMLAIGYQLLRLGRAALVQIWQKTAGRPRLRRAAVVLLAAVAVLLVAAWWPDPGRYRPVERDESGTVLDLLPMTQQVTLAEAPAPVHRAPASVWAATSSPPTRQHARLALVLTPAEPTAPPAAAGDAAADGPVGSAPATGAPGGSAPTWVFPFDPPKAPGEGDNQALAVNTGDGSTRYDVSFALVWADEGEVLQRNEAYALASCADCRTVAIAFQVVLVVGQADVVVPQNISAAVNYDCVRCLTLAVARQLVLTFPGEPSEATKTRLDELWQRIAAFGATVEDLPPAQIVVALYNFEKEITTIVRAEIEAQPGLTPGPSSGASAPPIAPPSADDAPPVTGAPRSTSVPASGTTAGSAEPGSPATAVPGSAVPGSAVPGSAVPSSAVPGSAVPSSAGTAYSATEPVAEAAVVAPRASPGR